MKILVINAGSSSLKYQLFNMKNTRVMTGGIFERIGEKTGIWTHKISIRGSKKKIVRKREIKNHTVAMRLAISMVIDPEKGVIDDAKQINVVGHRVVQGGEAFKSAVLINDTVKKSIRKNNPLAPLHNPPNLMGIEVCQKLLTGIPNIAIFDTEFHQTMPPKAFLYALPSEFYTKFSVRKYGFHGTSHKYIAHETAKLLNRDIETINLITIHLGNGCSVSAVEKGKSIDTSMGMTPLSGVMMGTRSGDIDPAILGYVMKQTGMRIEELNALLNKQSGLKGICGMNDMRDIHDASAKGHPRASLALEMFCYQIKKYIGAYAAALGSIDAIVFSAGVGENDAVVREKICDTLSCIGIRIDNKKNYSKQPKPFSLHSTDSPVAIWVVPTNEEYQIAKEALDVMKQLEK